MNALNRTLVVPPTTLYREVGDEAVILDLSSETYFGLDPIGASMWHAMVESQSLHAAIDRLLASYQVERPVLERDLLDLVDKLETRGLVGTRPIDG